MTTPTTPSYVDMKFVKSLGIIPPHDIDAVEALYPDTFKNASEQVSRKFDDRAIAAGEKDAVKKHIAALVIAEIKKKRGELSEQIEFAIKSAADDAKAWLEASKSIDESKAAATAPRPSTPPTGSTP